MGAPLFPGNYASPGSYPTMIAPQPPAPTFPGPAPLNGPAQGYDAFSQHSSNAPIIPPPIPGTTFPPPFLPTTQPNPSLLQPSPVFPPPVPVPTFPTPQPIAFAPPPVTNFTPPNGPATFGQANQAQNSLLGLPNPEFPGPGKPAFPTPPMIPSNAPISAAPQNFPIMGGPPPFTAEPMTIPQTVYSYPSTTQNQTPAFPAYTA